MGILAGESSRESSDHRVEQSANTDTSKPQSRTVSELELSLEIEKLKYRVLEQEHALKYQEMRLAGGQNQQNDYPAIGRAIDYNPESMGPQTISKPSISSRSMKNDETVVKQQETEDVVDDHVDSEESLQPDSNEIKSNDLEEEDAVHDDNAKTIESQESELTPNENHEDTPVNETAILDDQPPIDQPSTDEENVTEKEPLVLPSLFDPPLKTPEELS